MLVMFVLMIGGSDMVSQVLFMFVIATIAMLIREFVSPFVGKITGIKLNIKKVSFDDLLGWGVLGGCGALVLYVLLLWVG